MPSSIIYNNLVLMTRKYKEQQPLARHHPRAMVNYFYFYEFLNNFVSITELKNNHFPTVQ